MWVIISEPKLNSFKPIFEIKHFQNNKFLYYGFCVFVYRRIYDLQLQAWTICYEWWYSNSQKGVRLYTGSNKQFTMAKFNT